MNILAIFNELTCSESVMFRLKTSLSVVQERGGGGTQGCNQGQFVHSAAILLYERPLAPIQSREQRVATYFSSTNCFWYSSYSSRVIPAALAGSEGVASSSLSPPPPKPIPDRGFPIMLLIRKAIPKSVTA